MRRFTTWNEVTSRMAIRRTSNAASASENPRFPLSAEPSRGTYDTP